MLAFGAFQILAMILFGTTTYHLNTTTRVHQVTDENGVVHD